jgi:hypothetical protein
MAYLSRDGIQPLIFVIPGRIEDANPESIPPDIQAARWIPGLVLRTIPE